jgi:hypothetical protein
MNHHRLTSTQSGPPFPWFGDSTHLKLSLRFPGYPCSFVRGINAQVLKERSAKHKGVGVKLIYQ